MVVLRKWLKVRWNGASLATYALLSTRRGERSQVGAHCPQRMSGSRRNCQLITLLWARSKCHTLATRLTPRFWRLCVDASLAPLFLLDKQPPRSPLNSMVTDPPAVDVRGGAQTRTLTHSPAQALGRSDRAAGQPGSQAARQTQTLISRNKPPATSGQERDAAPAPATLRLIQADEVRRESSQDYACLCRQCISSASKIVALMEHFCPLWRRCFDVAGHSGTHQRIVGIRLPSETACASFRDAGFGFSGLHLCLMSTPMFGLLVCLARSHYVVVATVASHARCRLTSIVPPCWPVRPASASSAAPAALHFRASSSSPQPHPQEAVVGPALRLPPS